MTALLIATGLAVVAYIVRRHMRRIQELEQRHAELLETLCLVTNEACLQPWLADSIRRAIAKEKGRT